MVSDRVLNLHDFADRAYRKAIVRGQLTGRIDGEPIVYVGRPSQWGNPFKIGDPDPQTPATVSRAEGRLIIAKGPLTRAASVALYREYAEAMLRRNPAWLAPLRGAKLACWCAPEPCHADILIELGA